MSPASAITAAVHLLGLKPGRNVSWVERDPFPTEDEVRAGARTHDIIAPEGDGCPLWSAALIRDYTESSPLNRTEWVQPPPVTGEPWPQLVCTRFRACTHGECVPHPAAVRVRLESRRRLNEWIEAATA